MFLGFGVTLGAALLVEALGLDRDGSRVNYAGYVRSSGHTMGMRGPNSSFRYPMPRPWEVLPDLDANMPAKPHTRFAGGCPCGMPRGRCGCGPRCGCPGCSARRQVPCPNCGDPRFGALCSTDIKDYGISGPCGCVIPPELANQMFGYNTSGIRGGGPRAFTQAEIAAYNRDGAAQGLRGSSVAPPA